MDPDALARPPSEAQFDSVEDGYLPAPTLERVLVAVKSEYPEFGFLNDVRIGILWKARGGTNKGAPRFGQLQKATGLLAHYCPDRFVIWIAADHVRDYHCSHFQLEALVYRELRHLSLEHNDKTGEDKLVITGYDFAGFVRELERYGAWHADLHRMQQTVQQLGLPVVE
jgi:hypothetical protein